ncbi:MAG: ribose-phosphate diphosphokinase [Gammaproteobacteria bacterium]|nr:ribose-phosphate diphosphokinase [Gammaproteobacteria bacterium]
MLLGFSDYREQASALAVKLGMAYKEATIHRFPDGESKVTLPPNLPENLIICRSLNDPNSKLVELLLAARTARELGARHLTLVAPYLCYMRQDIAFRPGEAVSQKIIGNFLASLFDALITVDPHLHRIARLNEAVPLQQSEALSAAPLIAEFLTRQNNPLLIGPDSESLQWVRSIAELCDFGYGVASKERLGDRKVLIELPDIDLRGRRVVLIDDVVSSGETMAIAAQNCLSAGAERVDALVTHALFAAGAEQRIHQAGASEIWSTDSIAHSSNAIFLAPLLSKTLEKF